MPSKYSSEHSIADAKEMAERTSIGFRVVEIQSMVDAFRKEVELTGLAEENLQARVRGTTLMGISNQEGHLVLATGNKSELACGYSTLYGDAVGGYAPIKDIYKVDVWALSQWRNKAAIAAGQMPSSRLMRRLMELRLTLKARARRSRLTPRSMARRSM